MVTLLRIWSGACLLLLAAFLTAAEPTKEEIAKAVKRLGDDSFEVRQKASEFLRQAGRAAEPALVEAAKSTDREVERRAREILADFKWGIYPDTPKNILELIEAYRGGENDAKLKAARDLIALGHTGCLALLKIASAEENEAVRRALHQEMTQEIVQTTGMFLLAGQHDILEDLLAQSLIGERDGSYRNYAAHLLLRGKLDAKIAEVQAKAIKEKAREDGQRQPAELLFFLTRAKGDAAGMRQAAELTGNGRLRTFALQEASAWKELADHYEKDNDPSDFAIERLSYALAYQRLAGTPEKRAKALAELEKFGKDNADDTSSAWLAAKALYLNDRPEEGLRLLLAGKQYHPAFDVLGTQYRIAEALQLAEKGEEAVEEQRLSLRLSLGRFLSTLGERAKAKAVFAKLSEQIGDRTRYPNSQDLLQLYMRLGLTDEAFAYGAELLRKEEKRDYRDPLLAALYPKHPEAAGVWWSVFRHQFTADQAPALLKEMTRLFDGKITGQEFDDLLKKAEKALAEPGQPLAPANLLALATAAAGAGRPELELKYLERAAEQPKQADALLRLADLLAGKQAWKEAAQRYRQAWDADRSQPLPLFLQGEALAQAGQQAEGDKLKKIAHWLPLGNERVRYQFAKALADKGFTTAAQRERELILRVGVLEDWAVNETMRHLAYDAWYRKDYQKAADLFEKFRLRCLRTDVYFIEFSAHVQVPALVHQSRARLLLKEGKIDEARNEVQQCLVLTPGNVNLPIRLLGDLEKAGRKTDADALFEQVFKVHDQLCKDYPHSATNWNTLAWLSACCRRQLARGQEAAETALRLAPNTAAYMDTQAEVLFQRGEQAQALALMKRCLELEPKNAYFQRQLKRIEAGDTKVDVPDEED